MEGVLLAFILTLFAGLATGVGGLLAFFKVAHNPKMLAISLGFSSGVMVYVSFVEILPKGVISLSEVLPTFSAWALGVTGFFVGFIIAGLIDRFVPMHEAAQSKRKISKNKNALLRTGMFTALAIGIHNFPEGLATFMAALQDPGLGVAIAVAIAIHNVPEGIAVSIPILNATGSRLKALWYSSLSGIAEPIGALVGYFALSWLFTGWTFGLIFTAVGGIMVYISIDELLPTAHMHGDHHHVIYGFAAGMLVMAVSLVLLLR